MNVGRYHSVHTWNQAPSGGRSACPERRFTDVVLEARTTPRLLAATAVQGSLRTQWGPISPGVVSQRLCSPQKQEKPPHAGRETGPYTHVCTQIHRTFQAQLHARSSRSTSVRALTQMHPHSQVLTLVHSHHRAGPTWQGLTPSSPLHPQCQEQGTPEDTQCANVGPDTTLRGVARTHPCRGRGSAVLSGCCGFHPRAGGPGAGPFLLAAAAHCPSGCPTGPHGQGTGDSQCWGQLRPRGQSLTWGTLRRWGSGTKRGCGGTRADGGRAEEKGSPMAAGERGKRDASPEPRCTGRWSMVGGGGRGQRPPGGESQRSRKRQRHRGRQRGTERQRDRDTDRETETQRDREKRGRRGR